MYSYDDTKMMYDWSCFITGQVRQFIPLCITDKEVEKIINNEESAS